jgi:hypothetical protein
VAGHCLYTLACDRAAKPREQAEGLCPLPQAPETMRNSGRNSIIFGLRVGIECCSGASMPRQTEIGCAIAPGTDGLSLKAARLFRQASKKSCGDAEQSARSMVILNRDARQLQA